MAHATGTAANLIDSLEQIRTFLKTNATLAAQSPSQVWTELRYIYDNVVMSDTNMTSADPLPMLRTLPVNTTLNGFSGGVSYIRWQLRTAKAMDSLMMRAGTVHIPTIYAPRSFRLQYSDDNVNWTTASTQTGLSWTSGELKTFSGWSATGTHIYWRILFDTVGTSGSTSGSIEISQLLAYVGTEIVNSSSAETYLKGPGLGGTDEIFIGFRTKRVSANSYYLLQVMGFSGYSAGAMYAEQQPGAMTLGSGAPYLSLWDSPMPFWFTASGRRIVFTFKVSTVYESGYAGFVLPYAPPSQFPYPLAIGGSMAASSTVLRYDGTTTAHSVFCMPGSTATYYGGSSAGNAAPVDSTLYVMNPTGQWEGYVNRTGGGTSDGVTRLISRCVLPHTSYDTTSEITNPASRGQPRECVGGGFTMQPHSLVCWLPTPSFLMGELDGTRQISGEGNAAENTGTVGGSPWVVFQNTFRTSRKEYWAQLAE